MSEGKKEVLVVASKVKKFVKEAHGMSCSAALMETLSAAVEKVVNEAVEEAKRDKKKTVMPRHVKTESPE
jgi:histone H3/H4